MAKVTISDAAKEMYHALHEILLQAEAGKPITDDLLARAQRASYMGDKVHALRTSVYDEAPDDRESPRKELPLIDLTDLYAAHDVLSESLENPDSDNDEIRDAAVHMCSVLNSTYGRLNYPDNQDEAAQADDSKLMVLDEQGQGQQINMPTIPTQDDVAKHMGERDLVNEAAARYEQRAIGQ